MDDFLLHDMLVYPGYDDFFFIYLDPLCKISVLSVCSSSCVLIAYLVMGVEFVSFFPDVSIYISGRPNPFDFMENMLEWMLLLMHSVSLLPFCRYSRFPFLSICCAMTNFV